MLGLLMMNVNSAGELPELELEEASSFGLARDMEGVSS
jgi:hypothetical protein